MHNAVKFGSGYYFWSGFSDIIYMKGVVCLKRIVSACIDEVLRFEDRQEADVFLRRLEYSPRKHRVESVDPQADGTVLIHILRQYNNSPLPEREE